MRRSLIIAAFLACLLVTVGFGATDSRRTIYVVNRSTLVTDQQIALALPAFQRQVDEDLGPAWDVSARLVLTDTPPAGAWTMIVTDDPACMFCGGYHEYRQGAVYAEVGATTDREWQLAFSHELAELLVDPYILPSGNHGRFALDGKKAWLVEVGDPVEDQKYSYESDGVLLSDFTLPAWYQHASAGPWDFTRSCKHAGQMLEGGYQWYVVKGKWVSL